MANFPSYYGCNEISHQKIFDYYNKLDDDIEKLKYLEFALYEYKAYIRADIPVFGISFEEIIPAFNFGVELINLIIAMRKEINLSRLQAGEGKYFTTDDLDFFREVKSLYFDLWHKSRELFKQLRYSTYLNDEEKAMVNELYESFFNDDNALPSPESAKKLPEKTDLPTKNTKISWQKDINDLAFLFSIFIESGYIPERSPYAAFIYDNFTWKQKPHDRKLETGRLAKTKENFIQFMKHPSEDFKLFIKKLYAEIIEHDRY